jgi:hypothetical protein
MLEPGSTSYDHSTFLSAGVVLGLVPQVPRVKRGRWRQQEFAATAPSALTTAVRWVLGTKPQVDT